jgi:NitT/TauT family transport system ATP-binding protein
MSDEIKKPESGGTANGDTAGSVTAGGDPTTADEQQKAVSGHEISLDIAVDQANSDVPIKIMLDGVGVTYPAPDGKIEAVRDVNLTVFDVPEAGEFIVFVGPSGCGKSTILKVIAGLVQPTVGRALLDNQPIDGPSREKGMVFQSYTSFDWLTVIENIEYGLKLQGVDPRKRRELAHAFCKAVGLAGFENVFPKNLSGGMKQRVAIARTLANNPRVILMDEPFGALDPQTRSEMQTLTLDVWDRLESTILFVTHDVSEAIFLADTIYVLSPRPASIIKRIKVPFSRSRTFDVMENNEFYALENEILSLLRNSDGDGDVRVSV